MECKQVHTLRGITFPQDMSKTEKYVKLSLVVRSLESKSRCFLVTQSKSKEWHKVLNETGQSSETVGIVASTVSASYMFVCLFIIFKTDHRRLILLSVASMSINYV